MSARPSDIPESVWEAAAQCLGRIAPYPVAWEGALPEAIAHAILAAEKRGEERERERLTDPVTLAKHLEVVGVVGREAVDEAILAERERCAQVVENDADLLLNCGKRAARAAERIAAAIRQVPTTNEGE